MIEEWRDIPGFEGRYQVSDLGRVRSLAHPVRCKGGATRMSPSKVLRPGTLSSGHRYVFLGRGNRRAVHRLVLETFVGPCPEGHEGLHRDHTPSNNKLLNLKWGTRSENIKTDYAAGTRKVHPNFNRWGYRYG